MAISQGHDNITRANHGSGLVCFAGIFPKISNKYNREAILKGPGCELLIDSASDAELAWIGE